MAGHEELQGTKIKFHGGVGPQGVAIYVTIIVDIFLLFFNRKLTDTFSEETYKYAEQFIRWNKLSTQVSCYCKETCDGGRNYCCTGPLNVYRHY
jgi:hypothetical protein